jgi:hypothetical protein
MQWLDVHTVPLVQLRQLRLEAGRDGVHLGLRLRDRDAVLQACDHEHVVASAIQVERLRDRRPDVGWRAGRCRRKLERRRHYADHHVEFAADCDRTADERGVGAEPLAPQALADDDDLSATRLIFVGDEHATRNWRDPHDGKEVGRDADADQLHRLARAGQIEVAVEDHAGHALERPRSRFPLGHLVGANDVAQILGAAALPHDRQAVRPGERKRTEQHRIDDAERRGRGADAQRHQRCDEEDKGGCARQHPPGLPEVVAETTHRHRSDPLDRRIAGEPLTHERSREVG